MELTHSFTVPVDVLTAWATFEDIGTVAECFPGATVTSVEGDTFEGTVKVKLGPIALQYAGSGLFVERDDATRRLVVEAKGRDKRGNGTAGAHVTAGFVEVDPANTRVDVVTDLQITGKPAQFGRGVMQDVSDKLLGQFVDCLAARIGGPGAPGPSEDTAAPPPSAEPPLVQDRAAPPAGESTPDAGARPAAPAEPPLVQGRAAPRAGEQSRTGPSTTDSIDLGTTVLPVLARTYGPRIAVGLLVVLLVRWVVRRRR